MSIEEVKKLTAEDYDGLKAQAMKGSHEAVRLMVQYAAWRKLSREKSVPEAVKEEAFNHLMSLVDIEVQVV